MHAHCICAYRLPQYSRTPQCMHTGSLHVDNPSAIGHLSLVNSFHGCLLPPCRYSILMHMDCSMYLDFLCFRLSYSVHESHILMSLSPSPSPVPSCALQVEEWQEVALHDTAHWACAVPWSFIQQINSTLIGILETNEKKLQVLLGIVSEFLNPSDLILTN